MRRRNATAIAATIAAACLTLAGCSTESPQSDVAAAEPGTATTIHIVQAPLTDFAPVWVAQAQGFFADEGLEVVTDSGGATTSAEAVALIVSGDYEFVSSASFGVALAMDQGIDIGLAVGLSAYPSAEDNRQLATVVTAAGPDTIEDLGAGPVVAVNGMGGLTNVAFAAGLDDAGLTGISPAYQAAAMPTIGDLVATGSAAAGVVAEPWVTAAQADPALKVIDYPGSMLPEGATAIGLATTRAYAEANPETVAGLRAALEAANEWIADEANRDELLEILAEHTGLDVELLGDSQLPTYSSAIDADATLDLLELFAEYGDLGNVPSIDQLVIG
ncbi:ABC transporter substrate-binding protein [Agromyces bauzanensis]